MKDRILRAALTLVWTAAVLAAGALALVIGANSAKADVITEFGGGYVVSAYSSDLAMPSCWKALPMRNIGTTDEPVAVPAHGDPNELLNCGGHTPVFEGWPIAWEFPNGVRLGLFHVSHWLDGKPFKGDGELTMTCLCASWTFHWRRH